ncbi:MAG: BON domain-containing protein [Rhodobacteraceae bacterium]|nr:MAG: BON domain-containing protein [Paracoccaceae bacterium]
MVRACRAPARRLAAAATVVITTAGCVPAVIGATAATVGVAASQERGAMGALSDMETQIAINNALLNHSGRLFANVNVAVNEGRVLLRGSVPTPEDSVEATRIAWTISGVREVINELNVDSMRGFSGFASDNWIATQLRSRLVRDPMIASRNYTIEIYDGVVHLIGIALSEDELRRATWHASVTPGVREVVSHVVLTDDVRRPDPAA